MITENLSHDDSAMPVRNKKAKDIVLPKLPRGEGTMTILDNGLIQFRKTLDYGSEKRRAAVYGKTPREAMTAMRGKEREAESIRKSPTRATLKVDMKEWLFKTQLHSIKPQSFDRMEITFRNQVELCAIGEMRYASIDASDIQAHLNNLVESRLSWSTIKKTYDLLNTYFRHKEDIGEIKDNPMDAVPVPSKDAILKPEKQIKYMNQAQIEIFTAEAEKLCKHSNRLAYMAPSMFS